MLHLIDYGVIAVYLVVTLAIGFWSARRARDSSKSFFVAERSLPWFVVGFTMVAASISAEQMLGEVGYGFGAGLAVSNWDLGVYPALVLMLFVFLPLYLRNGITTIPEYLEKRYDKTTRLLFAIYTVFNNACITLVMVLALGSTAIRYFTESGGAGGLPQIYGAVLIAAFTGLYTVYGGMSSVAWTDTFQCLLLLAGGLLIFFIGLGHVPGGWSGLFERMEHPHLIGGLDHPVMPWPGLILLMLSTNVWYCCTNQFYVQSTLGAKDEWHGRMGVLLTAFLGPIMTLCFAFPGYIAGDLVRQGLMEPITDADATYTKLIEKFLGPGARGFMAAAVLGAIMSSVASIVNATASVYTIDIHQRWLRPAATQPQLVRAGRIAGFASLVIALPLVMVAVQKRYIFTYSQNAWCILAIPIMLVFTLGALWRRVTSQAANATFLLILPFVAVPFVWGNKDDSYLDFHGYRVHLFNFAFVLWLSAAALMVLISLVTRHKVHAERKCSVCGYRVEGLSARTCPQCSADLQMTGVIEPVNLDAYVWRIGMGRLPADRGRAWYARIGFWTVIAGLMYALIYYSYW